MKEREKILQKKSKFRKIGGIHMEKKKILKSILIIIIAIIAIFIIHPIKNYIIITGLQNKITQYKDSTNYNIKSTAKEENGTTIKIVG